jgi:signal transduction histidine kinase
MSAMEIGTPLNYQSFNDRLARQLEDYFGRTGIVSDEFSELLRVINRTYNDMGARISQLEEERKAAEPGRTLHTGNSGQDTMFFEQFVNIIAHNLRVPLANIRALCGLLREGELSKREQQKCLSGLNLSAEKLDAVVTDLAKMQSLIFTVENTWQNVSLAEIIHDIQALLAHTVVNEEVVFQLELKVDRINSVKSYLTSILYNLIVNSIRHRSRDTTPFIFIGSESEHGRLILTVKDNGSGIDLEKNGDSLFGLYKKFSDDTEGSGMGLFIVKTQVELLGGTISVESEPARGAAFTISLPAKLH